MTTNPNPSSTVTRDLALLVLRVALGAIFIAHGGQKLFWFGIAGTTEAFLQMGVFLPAVTAPAVSAMELFGGLALVAGVFTRLAAAGIAVVMLGAMVMVHLPAGFFLPNGIEFALMNFAAAVALALMGGGTYSVDGKRKAARRKAGASAAAPSPAVAAPSRGPAPEPSEPEPTSPATPESDAAEQGDPSKGGEAG